MCCRLKECVLFYTVSALTVVAETVLYGAGSTAIAPLQRQFALQFQAETQNSGARVAYNATGSGQGKAMLIQKQVDFVWSELPLMGR